MFALSTAVGMFNKEDFGLFTSIAIVKGEA
jgi:hypothetical protein